MEQQKHNYKDSSKKSKILRKPLDVLYNLYGAFEHETDVYSQRMEIDGYWKLSHRTVSVEEKCHKDDWSFQDEMLFELEHWNLDGSFRKKGWALGLMKSDVVLDFCHKTGDFYIYRTAPMMVYIRSCYHSQNFPYDVKYRWCENQPDFGTPFETKNLKMPRKYIKEFLYKSGNITNGKATIK